MSILKRNPGNTGKRENRTVYIQKEFDVLNCVPTDYKYTKQYAEFIKNAQSDFRKRLDKMVIDDLCDTVFDAYIDAQINQMKQFAKEQHICHMNEIRNYKGIMHGEIIRATGYLSCLENDLKEIEQVIDIYKNMRQKAKACAN